MEGELGNSYLYKVSGIMVNKSLRFYQSAMPTDEDDIKAQLAGLLDTLSLLTAQARAYDRILPSDNFVARAADRLIRG